MMTANHEHTPTKGDLKKAWDWYRANQDKQSGIEQNFRTYRLEFLRAWDAIETAAEQRGAAAALREAASIKLGNEYYEMLVEDELNTRADQMEGDDE